jgi:hypothetical protein
LSSKPTTKSKEISRKSSFITILSELILEWKKGYENGADFFPLKTLSEF